MRKPKKPSWLDWLAQVLKVTGVVTFLTVGVGWGGWGLFRFFSPPSAPTTKPRWLDDAPLEKIQTIVSPTQKNHWRLYYRYTLSSKLADHGPLSVVHAITEWLSVRTSDDGHATPVSLI